MVLFFTSRLYGDGVQVYSRCPRVGLVEWRRPAPPRDAPVRPAAPRRDGGALRARRAAFAGALAGGVARYCMIWPAYTDTDVQLQGLSDCSSFIGQI